MTRRILSFYFGTCLLMVAATSGVRAAELPIRKAGLWEMKVLRTGSPMPEMTMQHCTDETTDKQMSTAFSPLLKEICSKNDVLQTATGYATDSVCSVGGASMTSHSDVTGDFNSAYTVKTRRIATAARPACTM
jgi:hypothetical protein